MVAVFHSVLGSRTERRAFGNEAPKKQMVRWIVPETHLPACYVRLPRRGGAACCLHVCCTQCGATRLRSHRGFHRSLCVCLALSCVCNCEETARLEEFPNKASVVFDQPNRFISKSGFFIRIKNTYLYCSIDTKLKYKTNFLSPLFSQQLTSLFYQANELGNSSILNKLHMLYL